MQGHTCRAHVKLGPLWEKEQGVSQWAGMPFAVFDTVLQCISAKRCKVSACNVKISKNGNCAGALGMTLRLLSALAMPLFLQERGEERSLFIFYIRVCIYSPTPQANELRRVSVSLCLQLRTSSSTTRCYFKPSFSVLCENRGVFMKRVFVVQRTDEAARGSVSFGSKSARLASRCRLLP